MWVKDKVSQSMINAVYSVLEAKVEPAAPDAEAIARRKKLQAIKDKQEDERAEKGTGIKGQDSVRTHKGTYGTEYKESEEWGEDGKCVSKPEAKKIAKKEVKGHEKKMHHEEIDLEQIEEAATRKDFQMVADLIRAHDSHDKRKELAGHHAAIFAQQNPRFDHHKFMKACGVTHEVYGEEHDFYANFRNKLIESMGDKKSEVLDEIMDEEKDMSDSQKAKREKIVKSMKGKTAEFKKKYGARWKNVMYATATKLAMQEDYVVDETALDEAVDTEKKTTDTLAGRIKGGKENQHSSFKIKLKAEEAHPDEAEDKKLIKKMVKKDCMKSEEVEIDLDQYDLDDLQAFMESEEFNQLDELSKDTLHSYVHKSFAQGNELHRKIRATTDPKERAKLKAQLSKRNTGVIRAAKKYTKEESSTWSFNEFVQTIEEARVSPTAGTRKVKTYGEGQKHHAEVRHNPEYNEYTVHHYKDGKHMGEGPISYHYDDKEDAHNTAKHEVERLNKMHSEEVEVKQPTLAEQLAKETLYKALTKGN